MTAIEPLAGEPPHGDQLPVLVTGRRSPQVDNILTPAALDFLAALSRRFECRRQHLLHMRRRDQSNYRHGAVPELPIETDWVRQATWTVAPAPADLSPQRIEIVAGVDRCSMVNALNSSADVYLADLEDSTTPAWANIVRGHLNLCDAVDGIIAYEDNSGYHSLDSDPATLMVQPRGWHSREDNVLVDGHPISASLFDAGLYAYHNAHTLIEGGSSVYFSLSKIENYFEARLWNDVFATLESELSLPRGTIRATVQIETVTAVFQMEEILFELREHVTTLRHGRWDYVASFIKAFRNRPEYVMPDRWTIDHRQSFVRASQQEMIRVCRRRGAHAIGGKLSRIPIGTPTMSRETALELVMDAVIRELETGFDGVHVTHPTVADLARGLLDARTSRATPPGPAPHASAADGLLMVPEGQVTEGGLRANISVTIRYLASWLGGQGSVPINGIIENTETVEIARLQVWQWVHHTTPLADGRSVTRDLVMAIISDELDALEANVGKIAVRVEHFEIAAQIAGSLMTGSFCDHLTDLNYTHLSAA